MWSQVVEIMASWKGRFAYTNDTRRKWPLYYGAGDCSSVINAAYHQHDPGLYKRLGGTPEAPLGARSYNIAANPKLVTVARGTLARGADLSNLVGKLRPGDIVCMGWATGYYHSSGICHVELYAGNGMCWGHGGPGKGPNFQRLGYWLYNTRVYVVKRVPPAPKPAPEKIIIQPEPVLKPRKTRRQKMYGIYYMDGKRYRVAIFEPTSGFFTEYTTNNAAYNNKIAALFDTGSFTEVSVSHYQAFKRDAELVRNKGTGRVATAIERLATILNAKEN